MGGDGEHVVLPISFCVHHMHLITTSSWEQHVDIITTSTSHDCSGSSAMQKRKRRFFDRLFPFTHALYFASYASAQSSISFVASPSAILPSMQWQ